MGATGRRVGTRAWRERGAGPGATLCSAIRAGHPPPPAPCPTHMVSQAGALSAPGQAAPPNALTTDRQVTPTWCCRESHRITPRRAQAGADLSLPASSSGSTRQVLGSILGESTGDWGCEPAAAIKPPAPGSPSPGSAFCRHQRDWWADQTLENEDPETRPVSLKGEVGGPDTRPAALTQSSHHGEISRGSELR